MAISIKEAFSSWDTLQDAIDCIYRFKQEAKIDSYITNDLNAIVGVIEANQSGIKWVYKV